TVLLLNLAVLLWILYKLLFAGEKWSIPQELRKRGEGIQTRMRDAEQAQEIEAAAKLAQKELHSLAAKLAIELAHQRIQDRLTPEQDEAVVRAGVGQLSQSGLGRPN